MGDHSNSLVHTKHTIKYPDENISENTQKQVVFLTQSGAEDVNLLLHGISSSELELHIKDCGRLIEVCMARYAETHCFSDRGEADHWRLEMESAIRSRNKTQERTQTGGGSGI